MRVSITDHADADLLSIYAHIYSATSSEELAADIVLKIRAKCTSVSEAPELGRPRDEFRPGVRSTRIYSYIILYEIAHQTIHILRILHGARDITPDDMSSPDAPTP